MRKVLCAIALAIPVVVFTQAPADSVSPRAKQLHDRAIVVDSHGDTTQRLIFDEAFDIGKRKRSSSTSTTPSRPPASITSASDPTSTAPRCRWVWKTRRNCRRSPMRC
jgi:hypothetical protein